jgi:phosphoribosylanthranilate isomerase
MNALRLRTRIKICGFTRPEDAVFAAHAGVDAIGLVFYAESPRHVTIKKAQEIVRALPAFVTVVALFVDENPQQIETVLDQVAIDCLQFHGNEPAEDCRQYRKPYIKAIRMQAKTDLQDIQRQYHDAAALLLDAWHPAVQGGSGHRFDWQMIPADLKLPVILAGGLDVGNAAEAVRAVKPYALDVSSGVEVKKGIKDHRKMMAFIQSTNQVSTEEK